MDKFRTGRPARDANSSRQTPKLPAFRHLLWSPDQASGSRDPATRSVCQAPKLPEVRHFFKGFRREAGTHRGARETPESRVAKKRAEFCQIFLARELDKKHPAAYNQELQSPASP